MEPVTTFGIGVHVGTQLGGATLGIVMEQLGNGGHLGSYMVQITTLAQSAAGSLLGGLGVGLDASGVGLELLGLDLLRLLHRLLDLRTHVGHPDHYQARLPGV